VDLIRFAAPRSWLAPEATPLLQKLWATDRPIVLDRMPWKNSEFDLGFEWIEFRTIDKVTLQFSDHDHMPSPGRTSLEYWEGITTLQGQWRQFQNDLIVGGLALLGVSPEIGQAALTYGFSPRRTCKVRCRFINQKQVEFAGFKVYGLSRFNLGRVRIEWGHGTVDRSYDGTLEVYNGQVIEVQPLGTTRMKENNSWTSTPASRRPGGIIVTVAYTKGQETDRTVLTLRTRSGSFSFLPREAIETEPIDIPDFGAYIKNNANPLGLSAFRRRNAGKFRIVQEVQKLPEQTLENASQKIRAKRVPLAFVGADANMHKFGVAPDGHLVIGYNDPSRGNPIVPKFAIYVAAGASPAPFPSSPVQPKVDFNSVARKRQSLEEGWQPIIRTAWSESDVGFERTDLAISPETMESPQETGNGQDLLESRLVIRNTSPIPQMVWYLMKPWKPATGEVGYGVLPSGVENSWEAEVSENQIFVVDGHEKYLLGRINSYGSGRVALDPTQGAVSYTVHANAFEEYTVDIFITGQPLPFSPELKAPDVKYEQVHTATSGYWRKLLVEGMEILVPDTHLQNLYNASLYHFLLAMTQDVQRGERYPNTATFYYGSIGSESAPVIHALDLRGMHERAGSCLEAWLSTQGDSQPDGDYVSRTGGFYHFWPIYTVDQGGVLWALAEHYLLTRDPNWLRIAAPHMIKGCDFILRARSRLLNKPSWEPEGAFLGLAPAGTLFDMRDWSQSFMLNGWFYFGLKKCAQALRAADPENAARIERGAEDYRRDLRQALKESVALSPAVRLRDNTSVPSVPPLPGLRGFRSAVKDIPNVGYGQGYIYHVEGGPLHLVNTEVLDPAEAEVTWMLAYLEDRFFTYSPPGSSVLDLSNLSEDWFDLGGFPKLQPYYLHYAEAYLLRDDIPNFIRAFYNTLAAIADPETLVFNESLMGGQPNKTHEEAWFFHQLRSMLVMEIGQDLFLARGTPRSWLEDGKRIVISKAPTHFGITGYDIRSFIKEGRIEAQVNPPARSHPDGLHPRLRTPMRVSIREVRINGKPWTDFDPAKEWIKLPKTKETLEAITLY
jgi:hypothetical protein